MRFRRQPGKEILECGGDNGFSGYEESVCVCPPFFSVQFRIFWVTEQRRIVTTQSGAEKKKREKIPFLVQKEKGFKRRLVSPPNAAAIINPFCRGKIVYRKEEDAENRDLLSPSFYPNPIPPSKVTSYPPPPLKFLIVHFGSGFVEGIYVVLPSILKETHVLP